MISPKSLMKIATTASVVAMTVSVAVVPAYAMQDIAIEDTPSSFAATVDDVQNSSNSMPDNPNATLPETVSENISDDSTVVSENLAVTPEGDVQNIETGETVTDAQLVGTQSQQPDPLAKTNGESFIPVSASNVKDAVEQSVKQSAEQSSLKGGSTVRLTKFESNEYGAHWGTYNGTKAFFDYRNNLFAQQAKGVIDVSSWQGDIDWAKAKADGVEGAIIRLGFGWGNDADTKAQRNINECKRLGIPFGIYWYSYAEDASGSRQEGNDVVSKLRQFGVSPNDLKYPVYYDLESWTWTGHTPPTNPNVYNGIVNAWYGALQSGGYQNLGVYSYTSYLQGPLNNANIYAKTRWVAQYGPQMEFTAFGTNDRGWQYTSSGQINGISGNVDMSAFGNKTFVSEMNFSDVDAKTPHADDIKWLVDNGIAEGWSDGTFRGMDSVKRQDMAAFLYRLAGSPEYAPGSAVEKRFADVDGRTPHAKEIWWLVDNGIAEGWSDGTFRGMDSVKRQD
ncbi:GH25 family lysozyme, partial [Bifidobacterium adolescentis]|uniref:GH25 family lysozyme n=1 Tax=Bifidobacterium adolescentis TaxID=1680 RepID=UPI0034A1F33C